MNGDGDFILLWTFAVQIIGNRLNRGGNDCITVGCKVAMQVIYLI